MRRTVTALLCAAALTVPAGNALAAAEKRSVTVTRSVKSPLVEVSRWGELQVAITVRLTTTTTGGKKTTSFKVTAMSFPVYPAHTDKSAYISEKALPILRQEVLNLSGNTIQLISGATDTSYAFVDALRGALARAKA